MDERRQSLLFSVATGAAVGAVALCGVSAPSLSPRAGPAPAGPAPEPAPPVAGPALQAAPARGLGPGADDARARDATRRPPAPRAERFAADPAVRAACPEDMTLVDGEFCPILPYSCVRRTDDVGYRCAEYARGVGCRGETDRRRFCIDRHEWPNEVGENPLVYVDWYEAKALCDSRGKRLCRRSEWILACEGPKRLPYPWGFVRQPSPCNIDRASIPFDVEAMIRDDTREVELARLWQADRLGSHPECVSAFGAYDLSGNVDEWTDDLADDPHTKSPSTLNGGYWGPVRDTCRLTTKSHGPTFKFYQVGFRCCGDTLDGVSVPPPRPFVEPEAAREEALYE